MFRAGTAITTVTAGFTHNPVPFRVLPLSAGADTGFGLTRFRPQFGAIVNSEELV